MWICSFIHRENIHGDYHNLFDKQNRNQSERPTHAVSREQRCICSILFENYISKISFNFSRGQWVNSLAPGKFEWNFRYVIFKRIFVFGGWGISCEIALICMSLDFTNDQSTLVQVMAWCQCWPRSLSPYGVTRPQWVKNAVSDNRGLD